jgi:hypothetical protein
VSCEEAMYVRAARSADFGARPESYSADRQTDVL